MANEVQLTIKVGDNGSLDVVAKKAEKAAKSTEKLSKSTDKASRSKNSYNKLEKGTAQLGANTTKSFAKQAQIVGNGLVPAYATLAANVFAITAAFNALKQAEAADLLAQGLDRVGDSAGRNLPYLADRLKEITGAAISTQQAMEQVALGTASGFSQEQLEGLAKVASGASKALGRDMGDALSRLTRGAAKLEPEILDELGIMVRLDEATTAYAASMGKTADQLTIVQRRQAFTNAILEQGIEKYGDIADAIDPSAYDQLAAAFDGLSKGFLNIINTGLTPFLNMLSGNSAALIGATTLFGSTISRQMVPALYEGANAAAENARGLAQQAKDTQANIKTTGQLPKVYSDLSKSIINGTATSEQFDGALKSLDRSLSSHNSQLKGITKEHGRESQQVKLKNEKINNVIAARKTLINTMVLEKQASAQTAAANAIEAASQFNIKQAIDFVKVSYAEKMAAEKLSAAATNTQIGLLAKLRSGFFAAGVSAKAFGAALLSAIPIIGQILFIGSMVLDWLISWAMEADEVKEATDKAADSLDNFGSAYQNLQDRLETDGVEAIVEQATTMAGVYGEIASRFKEINQVIKSSSEGELAQLNADITEVSQRLEGTYDGGFFDIFTDIDAIKGPKLLEADLAELQARRDKLLSEPVKGKDIIDVEATQRLLTSAITNLQVFGDEAQGSINVLTNLKGILTEDTEVEVVQSILDALPAADKQIVETVESMKAAFGSFQEEVAKNAKKKITPFDGLFQQVDLINKQLIDLSGNPEAQQAIINTMPDSFKETIGSTAVEVASFHKRMKESLDTLIAAPGQIQQNEFAMNKLKKATRESSLATGEFIDLQNATTNVRINALDAEEKIIRDSLGNDETKLAGNARLAEIASERLALAQKIISPELRSAEIAVVQVKEKQKLLGIEKKIATANRATFEAQAKSRRIMAEMETLTADPTSRDTGVTARQERDIFEKEKEQRIALALSEHELKKQAIEMEYDLLEAQAKLLRVRLQEANQNTDGINNYIEKLGEAETAANTAADAALANTLAQITLQSTTNQADVEAAVLAAAGQGASTSERLGNLGKAGGLGEFDTLNEKVAATREALQPMMDDLKKLGPEGELVAAIAEGSFVIADSFSKAFESGAKGMDKAAAVAQAVGDTIGAVNSMMQASIQASIAKIDEQIAAEKKRDGKSAQSVARIQALEKKKEAQQRKAFETNKKMLMAQTVANTAAGIMRAIAEGGLAGIVIGSVIAAMGAAQLAIISSQTYQGGSSSAPPAPTGISMGKRRSTVDLARSEGAAGELGYLRGEGGTGGPENFRRGFAGLKYRAEGGNTGIVVGEQGPELFVPSTPGRVVPNDDIGASNQNINFSINAVDAAGVEELLVNQRGNIIGMLREASNSYGEPFMEKVNTQVYSSQGGVSRYGER